MYAVDNMAVGYAEMLMLWYSYILWIICHMDYAYADMLFFMFWYPENLTIPKCVEDHGEEDKLPEEGDDEGGGRDDLGQEEEEHGQGEQDRDG